jgi:hypothetical protein
VVVLASGLKYSGVTNTDLALAVGAVLLVILAESAWVTRRSVTVNSRKVVPVGAVAVRE